MVRQRLTKFTFYRYRYMLAYTVFSISLAAMLLLAGFYLPGGITKTEMNSVLISDTISISNILSLPPEQLVYLPYRLLQSISIDIFGVTVLGVKLPSILLGFASALGLLYLLNLWYKKNVAIIVAIIAVTTNQFLLASQAGQAGITYILLTVMILIAASMIARRSMYAKAWALAGFVVAAVSLYMPLNIYILVALILTALVHPHARYLVFKKSSKVTVAIGIMLSLLVSLPLILGAINNPSIIRRLMGIPEDFNSILGNAGQLLQSYTQFTAPTAGDVITPVYGLGLVVLIFVGIYRLFTTKYTARSYVISFWLVALIPFVFLNPEFISITFVPVMLLIALGVDYLIVSWYRLFPHNPYARVFGLAPLGILLIGLVLSSVDRYAYGLHYDSAVYASYNYDVTLLQKELRSLDDSSSVILLVSKDNEPFYTSLAKHQRQVASLTVTSNSNNAHTADILIAERDFSSIISSVPSEILVTRASEDANRFYLYKNDAS
jgi:hypothetical protein